MTSPTRPEPPTGGRPLGGRRLAIVLLGVMLGLLFSALSQTIVGTSMPRIVADLGGLDHYTWVFTAFLLTSTAGVPVFGKLSDLYGRKWFYVGGMLGFMLGSALCGQAQTMTQLIVFRALQGIAGGILTANAFAIIGDLFPPVERGKWQGLTGGVFGLASVVGPLLGGWLTDGPGWRWVFYVNLPVGALGAAVLAYGLPHARPHGRGPVDWWGAATIVAASVALLLAFSWGGGVYAWRSPQIVGLLALAAALVVAFLSAERRAAEPILPLALFGNRVFTVSIAAMFLLGAGMFGAILFVPLFVQGVLGVSAADSGVVLTPMMLSLVAASTVGGQVVSRTGRYKWLAVGGLAAMAGGMWLLSRMGAGTETTVVVRNMIVVGLGLGAAMPIFPIAVQNAFPARELGVVTAATQFFRSIGATIGVALMGTFLSSRLAAELRADLPGEVARALPPATLATLNPQALASPVARQALAAALVDVPDGPQLLDALFGAMRLALATAIRDVFLLAAGIGVLAVMVACFLRELPLRKRNHEPVLIEAGKELAVEGAAEAVVVPAQAAPRLFVGGDEH